MMTWSAWPDDQRAATEVPRNAGHPPLLPGADQISFLDIDDTMKATYGYAKQGAGYGYNGVKGLNAPLGTVTTPTGAPLICGALLRRGSTGSARGAARFVASCVHTAQGAGAGRDGALVVMRADSAFYSHAVVTAVGRAGACFSITARQNRSVQAAIATIDAQAWTPIQYPNAIFDEAEQRWISDAEVAEIDYTAFTSRATAEQVTARLIVRRVKRLQSGAKASGQGVLFDTYRYHAVFTDTPITMLQAESQHRGHAIIEGVHADLRAGALAHLPAGHFQANAAWLQCSVMAFNLTRAASALAGGLHTKATTASLRAPDQRPGPHHHLRAPPDPAPTPRLALGNRVATTLRHRHHRATHPSSSLTTKPQRARPEEQKWKSRTDRPMTAAPIPQCEHDTQKSR